MIYALEATELFINPRKVSPYSPEERLKMSPNFGISAFKLLPELFGIQVGNGSSFVSVPYLSELVRFSAREKMQPEFGAGTAFATSPSAQVAIEQTLEHFSLRKSSIISNLATHTGQLTVRAACDILYCSKDAIEEAVSQSGIEAPKEPIGGSTLRRVFAVEDLDRLYEFTYPQSYPQDLRGTPAK
jgi:hypothetical protein